MSLEMVEYSTATKLASLYRATMDELKEILPKVGALVDRLNEEFMPSTYRSFDLGIDLDRHSRHLSSNPSDPKFLEALESEFRKTAWRVLVDKTGIRKLMSTKRVKQLDDLLEKGYTILDDGTRETLPDITDSSIMEVLQGFMNSVDDFLTEAVREEFDYWKPRKAYSNYKTNHKHTCRLEKKLIQSYAFDVWKYGGKSEVSGLSHHLQPHITALDNIMHLLDGKGFAAGYSGPLVDSIRADAKAMEAETDYFRAKWFNNGNLHLEFKRQDLLDKFNEICGRNRLAEAC